MLSRADFNTISSLNILGVFMENAPIFLMGLLSHECKNCIRKVNEHLIAEYILTLIAFEQLLKCKKRSVSSVNTNQRIPLQLLAFLQLQVAHTGLKVCTAVLWGVKSLWNVCSH